MCGAITKVLGAVIGDLLKAAIALAVRSAQTWPWRRSADGRQLPGRDARPHRHLFWRWRLTSSPSQSLPALPSQVGAAYFWYGHGLVSAVVPAGPIKLFLLDTFIDDGLVALLSLTIAWSFMGRLRQLLSALVFSVLAWYVALPLFFSTKVSWLASVTKYLNPTVSAWLEAGRYGVSSVFVLLALNAWFNLVRSVTASSEDVPAKAAEKAKKTN